MTPTDSLVLFDTNAASAFLSRAEVVDPNEETAEVYGREKARLRRLGRMIPENDLWIGAMALQLGLRLVTQDSHFRDLDGVTIVTW